MEEGKGKWKVFDEEWIASVFHPVPEVQLVIDALSSPDQVLDTLMDPKGLWEHDEENETSVSLLFRRSRGLVFLRSVKTKVAGLARVRLRLWGTQWVEFLAGGGAMVTIHFFDEAERCHLVTRFLVFDGAPLGHGSGSVLLVYREQTSSPQLAVNLSKGAIVKSHLRLCHVIKARALAQPLGEQKVPWWRQEVTQAILKKKLSSQELILWEKLPLEEIRAQIMSPEKGVKVGERIWNLKPYQDVFVGNEAVDWIVERYAVSRDGAVLLMREIQKMGLLRHVVDQNKLFSDEHLFFVWTTTTSSPDPTTSATTTTTSTTSASLQKELADRDQRIDDLEDQVAELRLELFQATAIAIKLSLADQGVRSNMDVQALFDEVADLDTKRWSVWLTRRLLQDAASTAEQEVVDQQRQVEEKQKARLAVATGQAWWQSSEFLPSMDDNDNDDDDDDDD